MVVLNRILDDVENDQLEITPISPYRVVTQATIFDDMNVDFSVDDHQRKWIDHLLDHLFLAVLSRQLRLEFSPLNLHFLYLIPVVEI